MSSDSFKPNNSSSSDTNSSELSNDDEILRAEEIDDGIISSEGELDDFLESLLAEKEVTEKQKDVEDSIEPQSAKETLVNLPKKSPLKVKKFENETFFKKIRSSFGLKDKEEEEWLIQDEMERTISEKLRLVNEKERKKKSKKSEQVIHEKSQFKDEKIKQEKLEHERLSTEEANKKKLELEKNRLAKEKAKKKRLMLERIAKKKAEQEKLDQEQLAKEKAEQERLEQERLVKEKAEKERIEQERLAKEKAEKERLVRERIAKKKAEQERLEQEHLAKEKAEKERIEQERLAKEKAEKERLVREHIAKETVEKERLVLEGIVKKNVAKEKLKKKPLNDFYEKGEVKQSFAELAKVMEQQVTSSETQPIQTRPIKRSVQLCGNNDDIKNIDLLRKIFYSPNDYILSTFMEKLEWSKVSHQLIQLTFSEVTIVIDHKLNTIFCDALLESEKYYYICNSLISSSEITAHELNYEEAEMHKNLRRDKLEYVHSIESFIWTTSLLVSHGRLPEDTDVLKKIKLKEGLDLDNFETIPHAKDIEKFLRNKHCSLIVVSQHLQIPQRYIFAFYNAVLSLDMIEVNIKNKEKVENKTLPKTVKPKIKPSLGNLFGWKK